MAEEKKSPKLYSVEEKLFFVFESLHRAIEISAEGYCPRISLSDQVFDFVTNEEFYKITTKFEKEKAFEIVENFKFLFDPNTPLHTLFNYFSFLPLPGFKKLSKQYEKKYREFFSQGKKPKFPENLEEPLKIDFSPHSNEIILNGVFLLSKPNIDSENDRVFRFLYNYPNKKITLARFKENGITVGKSFSQIIRDLGFLGDLGRVFFMASQRAITFRNPVTRKILEDLGINKIRIHTKRNKKNH